MNKGETNLWLGVSETARNALTPRDYKLSSLPQRVAQSGVPAGELVRADRSSPEIKRAWIPGVEIFSRTIHSQRHRGVFGENRILAEAMVGRAHVCAQRQRISCTHTEHSGRYDRREMAAPFVHARARELFAASLR